MRVLLPIVHSTHYYNEQDICSVILFFNDECFANNAPYDSNRPSIAAVAVTRTMIFIFYLQTFFPLPILLIFAAATLGMITFGGSGYKCGNDN
jgi:hypothetical protein